MLICLDLWSINEKKNPFILSISGIQSQSGLTFCMHFSCATLDSTHDGLGIGNEWKQVCWTKSNLCNKSESQARHWIPLLLLPCTWLFVLLTDCTLHLPKTFNGFWWPKKCLTCEYLRSSVIFSHFLHFASLTFFFFPLVLILDHWSAKVCSLLPVFAVWHEHRRNGLVQSEWKSFLKG